MAILKRSRQREAILDFLKSRTDHPTADVVYANLRESDPKISLGTVYRNLSLLSDMGEIQKIVAGDGKEHFDGNTAPHDHFRCESCGRVLDLFHPSQEIDPVSQYPDFKGRIRAYQTIFYGTCPDCLGKDIS